MQHETSVTAARAVLDEFMAAFSAADVEAIRASFNFPHVRFHSGKVTVFAAAADFNLDIFRATTDAREWSRSEWLERRVIHAGAEKVHFDTAFRRLRTDGSEIATYRSIYIVTRIDGHWGIQGRSSFAP